ncbi:Glycosyl transferase, family 9 [Candidatus Magnetoovum chiemensis]|nr:Glycosyl transferase, family 9 [Candidatus Magnetoovum chiemensis]
MALGSEEEKPLVHQIISAMKAEKPLNFAGALNIRELAGVISRAGLFICNDSAPMHIAASLNVPTVAIFGPSKSVETSPYGNVYSVVEKDYPCRYTCDETTCHHKPRWGCMEDITVEDVFDAVCELF